ncbi:MULTISPECIES: flavodoxin family protein [unclassified Kribbella]|uniref:flavodoxin family protein n=1 Tax=unclassified Kribbella TaxID=2644121 RepID=UPI003017CED5
MSTAQTPRALIVYESMFGNTHKIALAIRDGLRDAIPTEVVRADQAPAEIPADVRLLVVGGPTHAFSMSRRSTRTQAAEQDQVMMPTETGIREWLQELPEPTTPTVAATFDTRVTKVRRLPGSAARSAAKLLRRHGFEPTVAPPASFFVHDMTGPLEQGEIDRARAWGEELAAELRPLSGSVRPLRRHRWSS